MVLLCLKYFPEAKKTVLHLLRIHQNDQQPCCILNCFTSVQPQFIIELFCSHGVVCMSWHGMACHGMVWYGMAWYGMIWHGMGWHSMAWHGMVWYGVVWYGMVWYGMVWHGIVWQGMVW